MKSPRDMTSEEIHAECNALAVYLERTSENIARHQALEAELDRRNMFKE